MSTRLRSIGHLGVFAALVALGATDCGPSPPPATPDSGVRGAGGTFITTPPDASATTPPGQCAVDNDCSTPQTMPVGCARAQCQQGTCVAVAVDADKDGDPTDNCRALDGVTTIQTGGDCDDTDPAVNSHHAEICDGKDNNCDGIIDNGVPPGTMTCTAGLGPCQAMGLLQCANGSYSKCDAVPKSPQTGVSECDGVDHNCNGKIENAQCQCVPGTVMTEQRTCASPTMVTCTSAGTIPTFDPGPAQSYYCLDADGDGSPSQTCGDFCPGSQPSGYIAVNPGNTVWDCSDNNPNVHPVLPNGSPPAPEICDGLDDDCNPATTEPPVSCGCGMQVACGQQCPSPTCPTGYSPDPSNAAQCLSDATSGLSTPTENVSGGLTGASYDKTYSMACPAGGVRVSFQAYKSSSDKNCIPYWTNSSDVNDCSVTVHYGCPAFQGFSCYVAIAYANPTPACHP